MLTDVDQSVNHEADSFAAKMGKSDGLQSAPSVNVVCSLGYLVTMPLLLQPFESVKLLQDMARVAPTHTEEWFVSDTRGEQG